ncbi:MAG TPA: glucoamylase family protein, partial [Microlunatus sp.]|nr:glucoamylase family protein [Microlunatus sp.]
PLAQRNRSGYTSPTNIGGYLWSTVVARDLGMISRRECSSRIDQTLRTLGKLEHHRPSGMFYNWYDEATGKKLTTWPVDGTRVYPFLSSVDNGWLAAALMVVQNADRANADRAGRLLRQMNFKVFYNPDAGQPEIDGSGRSGLMKGGFWDGEPKPGDKIQVGNFLGRGPDVNYTEFHYDTTVSETRIASYIAIARRQVPAKLYFGTWRTFPATADWSWHEQQPTGRDRTYLGIKVYEGVYEHLGLEVVPGWGGSMFEALMPNMFVPEERWSPRAWGPNHRNTVAIHRLHGLEEADYGFWGFSPASDPAGGYREYGVDAIGLNQDGYFSDQEKTNFDKGFGDIRPGTNPEPDYGDGVVTPHALFLAMHHEPRHAYDNLVKLTRNFDAYGEGGFYDAIAVKSGKVAKRYLSLDQAMVMGSIGNVFGRQAVRRYFAVGDVERRVRPLLAMERFSL